MSGHHAPQEPHKKMPGAVSNGRLRGPEAQRGLMPDTGLSRGYVRFAITAHHGYLRCILGSESAAVCAAGGRHRERSAAVGSVADAGPAVSVAAALRPTAMRRTLPAALPVAFLLPAAITAAMTSAS
jgi:hypothetical protein